MGTTPARSATATAPSSTATPRTLPASLLRSRRRLTAVPASPPRTTPSSSSPVTPPSCCSPPSSPPPPRWWRAARPRPPRRLTRRSELLTRGNTWRRRHQHPLVSPPSHRQHLLDNPGVSSYTFLSMFPKFVFTFTVKSFAGYVASCPAALV